VLHFYVVRLVLFGCWMLPLVLAYFGIVASSWLYAHGLWLNPGPVIIGMFLHTLSLRGETSDAAHGAHGAAATHPGVLARIRAPFALLLKHHPGSVLVQLPLTVILLLLAMQH
jgi:hypothetical protein